jgi:selT/selW/selH-like putative selenoprotein
MTIERALGIKAVLIHSKEMGALEVRVDGKLVFSKKESTRFPDHAEIVEILSIMKDRETLKVAK